MKTIAISGSLRENVGKRDAKELRYEGRVPAVLYGGGEQIHFSVSESDLTKLIYTPEANFVNIQVGDINVQAVVKEIQFHPLTDRVLHIDFLELKDHKPVQMKIPVKLVGTSPGVKLGGKLNQKLRKLHVEALPKNLPQNIEISIEEVEIGKSIRVGDVKLENIKILNNAEDTILSVGMSRVLRQAEQEAANAK